MRRATVKVTDAPRPLPAGGSQAIHSRTGALASLCSSRAVLPPSPQPGPRSHRRWGRLAATFSRFVSATQPTATTASEASASNRVKTMRTPSGVFANASMAPKLSYPERYGVICRCLAAHADACDFVESREAMPSPATSTIERLRCGIQPEVSWPSGHGRRLLRLCFDGQACDECCQESSEAPAGNPGMHRGEQ